MKKKKKSNVLTEIMGLGDILCQIRNKNVRYNF